MPTNTIYQDGDNSQLRSVIFNATPLAIQQTKSIARQFQGKTEIDTCKNIFDYLKNKLRYEADGVHQKVKLPSALLRERVGDCKSYSVFTYAILTNLGIPCKYVLTSYNNDPSPSHIYVVTDSGIIIDAVWGKFNSEKQPTYKYLKKIEDMRISTITGINADKKVQIGASCCTDKRIGLTAEQWYDQNQGLVRGKDKALYVAAKIPAAPMRELMIRFIEANGGGIATSVWNKIYRAEGLKLTIPQSDIDSINAKWKSNGLKYGVRFPTEAQNNTIKNLISLQVVGYEGKGFTRKPILKAKMDIKQAWDRVKGAGQYDLYVKHYGTPLSNDLKALESKFTTGKVKDSDIFNYREFLKSWYRFGGNPNDIKLAVARGKDKRPKGKDANYMLMISATRGLKVKDLGLIIRGFVSAFGGEQFDWGSDKTYIFGTSQNKVGIGEPVTAATITAWISAISGLLALISKIFTYFDSREDKKESEKEMHKLETDGYILEQDYYSLPIPRKKVIDIKQISVPTAEAPSLGEIGSAVEFFSGFLASSNKDANTPPTLAELEAKKKEGAFPPFVAQEVDNAKKDKYTLEALQKASQLTNRLVPITGETIVTYYKLSDIDTDDKDDKDFKAGFGNAVLPILIGVGVIMALNKAKK
jgi:hypothetical protein